MHNKNHRESERNGSVRERSRSSRAKINLFGTISMFLLIICSFALDIWVMVSKMLPTKYMILIMLFLLIINAGNVLVQVPRRRKLAGKLICAILSVILSAAMIFGMVALGSVQNALNKISGKLQQTTVIDVIVPANDPAQSIQDAKGYQFGVLKTMDSDMLTATKDDLSGKVGTVQTTPYTSITSLADALYAGEVDAILINDSFISMLTDLNGYKSFSTDTRILYQFNYVTNVSVTDPNANTAKEPFAVYLSGTDARFDDLSVASRSDVNILAVVNPKSKQVLLINTPRDYYVPLAVDEPGAYDKLTHAGIYGVDCSMQTLANLYGIEIPYYARVNFNGFRSLVDALGGITVDSAVEFSVEMGVDGGDGYGGYFSYHEGENELDGAAALAFCRERYAFSDGDNQRGRNQMAVIQGIINKATSPAILAKYQGVLSAVTECVSTNLSYNDITSLVQLTLKGGDGWNIASFSVSGAGDQSDSCYSYPGQSLYVTDMDETSISNAKQLINAVVNGEIPDVNALN
jgi:LCP family protein required for cell wall assembly